MYRCIFKVSFYFRGSLYEINVLLTLFLHIEVSILRKKQCTINFEADNWPIKWATALSEAGIPISKLDVKFRKFPKSKLDIKFLPKAHFANNIWTVLSQSKNNI